VRRASLGLCCALWGCSDAAPTEPPATPSPPDASRYAEGRVPVPGCERFDYAPCDIQIPACVGNLAGIARCMRGGDPQSAVPPVAFLSQTDAELDLLASLESQAPPNPNHFEIALARFGLTRPQAFEPSIMAARLAAEWAGYYEQGRREIVVIEHVPPRTELIQNVLLLHELIHAMQDSDHDLRAFGEQYRDGVDANLRASSISEGEARMHERRYFAASLGLDVTTLDFGESFANLRASSEQWVFAQDDLYTASQLSVPYAHGAAYVFGVWSTGGQSAVRALFDAPPISMLPILATVWSGAIGVQASTAERPVEPAPPGLSLAASTSMGPWSIYLLGRLGLLEDSPARALALAWTSDRLEVFSFGSGGAETAARWSIDFADASGAAQLVQSLTEHPSIYLRHDGTRVTLLTASSPEPTGL
jgi:hypothetical protein